LRNLETQFDEFALDFSITPARIFYSEFEYQVLKFFADRWSTTFVFTLINPFLANKFSMPPKNGYGLEERMKFRSWLVGWFASFFSFMVRTD
jgi:hypothetical protein